MNVELLALLQYEGGIHPGSSSGVVRTIEYLTQLQMISRTLLCYLWSLHFGGVLKSTLMYPISTFKTVALKRWSMNQKPLKQSGNAQAPWVWIVFWVQILSNECTSCFCDWVWCGLQQDWIIKTDSQCKWKLDSERCVCAFYESGVIYMYLMQIKKCKQKYF